MSENRYTITRELPDNPKITEDYCNIFERALDATITCKCGNNFPVYQPYSYYQCGCGRIYIPKIVVDLYEEEWMNYHADGWRWSQ